jgi:hypothetical protein
MDHPAPHQLKGTPTMGRSVSYPHNTLILTFATYETYEAVTQDLIDDGIYEQDQLGDLIPRDYAFDDMLEDFIETCKSEWPSLTECDEWIGREDRAVLSNGLVKMGISEYCGLLSYWVVAQDDLHADAWYGRPDRTALAEHWARQIEAKFVKYFGTLRKLGSMSNGEGVYQRAA